LNRSAALLAGALAAALAVPAGAPRAAETRPAPGGGSLGQKRSVGPDAALEGTLEVAKKTDQGPAGPKLGFEQFRAGIEVKIPYTGIFSLFFKREIDKGINFSVC
jgi:hypothetical protein